MLLSVWTTLGMTLVLLHQLDTTHNNNNNNNNSSTSLISTLTTSSLPNSLLSWRYHQLQVPPSKRTQSTTNHKNATHSSPPRVVLYHRYHDEPTWTFPVSSASSSRWLSLTDGFLMPPGNVLVTKKTTPIHYWELPPPPSQRSSSSSSHHDDAHYDPTSSHQKDKDDACVPMASWQTLSFPSCNLFHEIDLTHVPNNFHSTTSSSSSSFVLNATTTATSSSIHNHHYNQDALYILGQGWFRITWQYDSYRRNDNSNIWTMESVVLKTLRLDRDFSAEFYELHRRDALAMERLTFSPYVMNVHGYCGQSALNELANFNVGGMTRLEELSRRLRNQPHTPQVYLTKLTLAYQLAMALYHVHTLPQQRPPRQQPLLLSLDDEDEDGDKQQQQQLPFMVHYDVNPRNVALVRGGRAKLNDFNTCELLRWNPQTKTTCGFRGRFHEPWWRAPEEMPLLVVNNDTTQSNTQKVVEDRGTTKATTKILDEKVDIYAMGNILYHILTTHSPHGKMKASRLVAMQEMVVQGHRPPLPVFYQLQQQRLDDNTSTTTTTLLVSPQDADYNYQQYCHNFNATAPQEVAIVAFLQAMDGCYPMDPAKRMTARQVALIFRRAIRRVKRIMMMMAPADEVTTIANG
jgi:hypothetical protein